MTTTSASTTGPATLPDGLRLGPVHLTVTDLARSIPFYENSIGLELARREGAQAALGAGGEDLLVLTEEPQARPAGRHAGLYHFALLHPSRLELARAAQRLIGDADARSAARPTTRSPRRSTCPTRTATASSWPPTGRASTGATSATRPPTAGRSRSTWSA